MSPGLYRHENRGVTNLAMKRMGGKPSAQEPCHPVSGQWRVEGKRRVRAPWLQAHRKEAADQRKTACPVAPQQSWCFTDTRSTEGEWHTGPEAELRVCCETRPIYTQYPGAQNPSHQLPIPSPATKEGGREAGGRGSPSEETERPT